MSAAVAQGSATLNQIYASIMSSTEHQTQALSAATTPTPSQLQAAREYISGVGLTVEAVVKFKLHKDNPNLTPLDRLP